MKNKFKFLVKLSFMKKIKSKWFLVANIIIALIVVALINIDGIISFFGGDFNKKSTIYIVDETQSISESLKTNLLLYEKNLYGDDSSSYEIDTTHINKDEVVDLIQNEDKKATLVYIYNDENGEIKVNITSLSTMETISYQIIVSAINNTIYTYNIYSSGLTEEQINKITKSVDIERTILDESINSEDENMEMIMTTVFPMIIMPFFMLTIFLIQFIGTEINDEKSTRSMEIIISNVSPKVHLASKIISNNLFIIFQVFLVGIYSFIAFKLRAMLGINHITGGLGSKVGSIVSSLKLNVFTDKFVLVIILTVILMFLTFIAYSLIAGILASMTTSAEDYQQVQTPLVFILLFGYYLAVMAGAFNGSILIKIISFFPLISAILSPSLLVLGQIGVIDVLISILVMIAFIFILIKYGIRIYKDGILNYSSSNLFKKMFKALKSKS